MDMKIFVFALLFLGLANADIIPPGYHSVTHTLYIDNLDDYPDYQFFVYPTSMSGGVALMDSSEIPVGYKFADAKLYAIKKSDMQNLSLEELPAAAMEGPGVGSITELPDSDPRTEIETHYVVRIADGNITLTETTQPEKPDVCPLSVILAGLCLIGALKIRP